MFGLGALVLSMLLALITYNFARTTLLRQRDKVAVSSAYDDARRLKNELRSGPPSVQPLLTGLGSGRPLVNYRDAWTAADNRFGPDQLPPALVKRVATDLVPARMSVKVSRENVIVVGIPLIEVDATFFEFFSLSEVDDTLRSVRIALLSGALITTMLGVVFGTFAARRAVRPLATAAQAAKAIAGGRLDTRLEDSDDPDLQVLSTSFNDMAAALQERVERDTRFTSDVSHELRSPLMTLSASVEVMQSRRDEMPDRAQSALDLLASDVTRFQGLVEDLLEISRFDAGAIRLHEEDLLVGEFVRQAVSVSSAAATPVEIHERAGDMIISGDRRRLARVVANLIDNGRLHGGGELEVNVEKPPGEDPPAHVWIIVSDRGPGVAVEDREIIFERFARGGSAGRRSVTEGAGLGLSLVDEHVRRHGGRVWVEDRPDGRPGARFVVELPAEEVA